MAQDSRDSKKLETDRRNFLAQCGRFAAVTPPVVSLMLSVSDKAEGQELATSGTTRTITQTIIPTDASLNDVPEAERPKKLATVIDSMGTMKIG